MTFEEVVDQAMAMLQRRGRVTYRLLKRQFTLDDEALADLKLELIAGQRLAVDEEGTVLVWTGAPHHGARYPLAGRGRATVPHRAPGGDSAAPARAASHLSPARSSARLGHSAPM